MAYIYMLFKYMPRTDRWLTKFNDPLVQQLLEHEASVALLVSAQELRVNSANEVLASMRQIAGLFLIATHQRIVIFDGFTHSPVIDRRIFRLRSRRVFNSSRQSARCVRACRAQPSLRAE
jgi:hypothetical protein